MKIRDKLPKYYIKDINGNSYQFNNIRSLKKQVREFDPEITPDYESFTLVSGVGYIEIPKDLLS